VAGGGDGLVRWLAGGLVAGLVALGLIVGAYAVGYHRGESDAREGQPAAAEPPPPPPTAPTEAQGGDRSAARGERLFTSQGCAGCHSLDGSAGAGPSVQGLPGRTVELDDGSTTTADRAYIERAIVDPDAEIVDGYQPGVMSLATESLDLESKPDDLQALVAYLESLPAGGS
jgi:cytochrome c oxidase subunit 2